MNAYRRHFIRLNMILVGSVLLITLLLVDAYVLRNSYRSMRQTMLETLEPFRGRNGALPFAPEQLQSGFPSEPPAESISPPEGEAGMSGEQPGGEIQPPGQDAPYGRCITVFYHNGEGTILSGIGDGDETVVLSAAEQAMAETEDFGYLSEYDLYYLTAGREPLVRLSLLPARYFRQSAVEASACLLAVFAATMLAFYGISRYISKIAVRPVEIAMSREKQFVTDISHDLKTPLAVIQACHHILLENPSQTIREAQPWMEKSSAAMQNMRALIDDMLTLSAMEAVQRLPQMESVDLSAVVTKAVLQMEAMAYDRGISLESSVQENVAAVGDADAFLRIVTGLIENALKYETKDGRIAVALCFCGRRALLTVQNFGTVIPDEDLPHVFERFYRSDKARDTHRGHGLGLAIIRRTVELMKGKIEVSSSQESGTVFTVSFG